jgi:Protein of unknown function (DUF4244)
LSTCPISIHIFIGLIYLIGVVPHAEQGSAPGRPEMGDVVLQRINEGRRILARVIWDANQGWESAQSWDANQANDVRYRPRFGFQPSPCSAGCSCPDREWCGPNAEEESSGGGFAIDAELPLPSDAGMSTVEYAVGTVVAAAFAAVLYKIVTGDSVISGLTNLINSALSTSF